MLSGSRPIQVLPPAVAAHVAELIDQRSSFIVGDAQGADYAFQKMLAGARYPLVEVYTSLSAPRSNLGGWRVHLVESGLKSRGAALHTAKDRHMVVRANAGVVIWDCQSVGSLANVIDFVEAEKPCWIWTPQEEFLFCVDSQSHLETLLLTYPNPATEARKRLTTFHNRERRRHELAQGGLF